MHKMVSFTSLFSHSNDDHRSSVLRSVLLALALTPFLFFLDPVLEIVSLKATRIAIGIGLLLGIVMSFVVGHTRQWDDSALFAAIGVLMISGTVLFVTVAGLIWVLVLSESSIVVTQFVLAVIWSMVLTAVGRHLVFPRVLA